LREERVEDLNRRALQVMKNRKRLTTALRIFTDNPAICQDIYSPFRPSRHRQSTDYLAHHTASRDIFFERKDRPGATHARSPVIPINRLFLLLIYFLSIGSIYHRSSIHLYAAILFVKLQRTQCLPISLTPHRPIIATGSSLGQSTPSA
jgi:hypothetical protein